MVSKVTANHSRSVRFNKRSTSILGNGHVHGTTSIPGTGLAKRYTVSDKDWHDWIPEEPDYGHKPPMWHDDQ